MIDWFTVVAQVINFLILVWLMKRYLYKPILNAIDARENRIAAELADAVAKREEAKKERDEFHKKNEAFDQQRAALLTKATADAGDEQKRLLDEARKAADGLSAKRQDALATEAKAFEVTLTQRTQHEVFAIARKTITDLAGVSLEASAASVFNQRLRSIGGPAKEKLAAAIRTSDEPAIIRSAFDLPPDARAAVQRALNETFSSDVCLRFETDADLISGIELNAGSQKIAWTIADYLKSMERSVADLLKSKPQAKEQ